MGGGSGDRRRRVPSRRPRPAEAGGTGRPRSREGAKRPRRDGGRGDGERRGRRRRRRRASELALERLVEDRGEEGVEFGGGFDLVLPERINLVSQSVQMPHDAMLIIE